MTRAETMRSLLDGLIGRLAPELPHPRAQESESISVRHATTPHTRIIIDPCPGPAEPLMVGTPAAVSGP